MAVVYQLLSWLGARVDAAIERRSAVRSAQNSHVYLVDGNRLSSNYSPAVT